MLPCRVGAGDLSAFFVVLLVLWAVSVGFKIGAWGSSWRPWPPASPSSSLPTWSSTPPYPAARSSSTPPSCSSSPLSLPPQTTYENLQSGGRPNVYDQGCLSNFLEVFCTKVQASKHNFRAYMQEEVRAPPANRFGEVEEELAAARCAKVEDDLGTGDLMRTGSGN